MEMINKFRISNYLHFATIKQVNKTLIVLILMFVFSINIVHSSTPKILYTDILSGPNSGGENNNGAYLSIFGTDFGSMSGLGSLTKVYINNQEIADYKYLGTSYGRDDVQQLSVQIGNVTSGPIRVEVNGIVSNLGHNFTVQPGNIWYMSLNGNDATGEIGNINLPFRTVQTPERTGVWHDVSPGDFIVIRGGDWMDEGSNERFLRLTGNSGSMPNGTQGSGPITIMGYPNENVHIFPQRAGGIHNRGNANEAHWIVITGFRISGGDGSNIEGPINMQWGSNDWRIINNELFDWFTLETDLTSRAARSGGIAGNGNRVKILGNHIRDIWGDGQRNHGIYIDNDGDPTSVVDIEIAYNHIHDIIGGNGIQSFGSLGERIQQYRVHHNLVYDVAKHGINAADKTDDAYFYNNIVCNADRNEFRINSKNATKLRVFNNVFCELGGGDESDLISNTWDLTNSDLIIANNIVYYGQDSNNAYAQSGVSSGWGIARFYNNLYYGLNAGAPSIDESPIGGGDTTDPLFVDPDLFNFRLFEQSIAIDAGSLNIPDVLNDDYYFNPRLEGSNPDVGAYEYPSDPNLIPPVIESLFPIPNTTDVNRNTQISFRLTDNLEGVDTSTLIVKVNNAVVYDGLNPNNYPSVTITGDILDYSFIYTPPSPFDFDTVVNVDIQVQDLQVPANILPIFSYTFTTSIYILPTILTTSLPPIYIGTPYQESIDVEGSETPLVWTYSGKLPAGIEFSDGILSGIASTEGDYTFSVTITDNNGQSDDQNFLLNVSIAPPRVVDGLILLYDFSQGNGTIIFDRSEVLPTTNLTIESSNVEWLSGNSGIEITGSSIIRNPSPTKLIEQLQATGQLSIEAWIEPANTTQTGPARIVSYSQGSSQRNFTLGQNLDSYDVRMRTLNTNNNGQPSISTNNNVVLTSLQHIVMTYDGTSRKIYVDNQLNNTEQNIVGDFSNWGSFELALANEIQSNREWLGKMYLVAIYNKALNTEEIEQNYNTGVGGNLENLIFKNDFESIKSLIKREIQR